LGLPFSASSCFKRRISSGWNDLNCFLYV
jgi:hypothetical protein